MKKVSYIVSLLSGAILLLTINRKTNITQGLLQPFEFLRWQDFHAMVTIPILILILYTLLFIHITQRRKEIHKYFGIFLVSFVVGALMYGISSGNYEVTNYLHHRFCMGESTSICEIIAYNDDGFSHLLFYISTLILTVTLLLFEKAQPQKNLISRYEQTIILANAGFIGLGLFANLAFEVIGIDLYAFGILSAIACYLLWTVRNQYHRYPIILYCAVGYGSGTVASLIAQVIR